MQISLQNSYLRNVKRYLIYITTLLLVVGCSAPQTADKACIYVSIAPLRALVEAIVEEDFPVEVLVPAGASPENFEPTPKQFIAVNEAQWLFSTGLIDFETTLLAKLRDQANIVDLSQEIPLIAGSCSHHHHGHHHTHGVDPHTWTAPRALKTMSRMIYETIHERYPDSVRYTQNFNRLQEKIDSLDRTVEACIKEAGVASFIIYHPALTYYARDYGLRQIAIEEEGKEPSAKRLAELIRTAQAEGIHTVLVQCQYPTSSVEAVARDMQAEVIVIDPLAEDVLDNIDRITDIITRK